MPRVIYAQCWRPRMFLLTVSAILFLTVARANAGETGSTDDYGGVSVINSVLLDPFDPVPQIQFGADCVGDCSRYGGRPPCLHDCRWNRWHCERDCYRPRRLYRPPPGAVPAPYGLPPPG